ncbi:MAG: dTMP kinase [Comamonadaceae bacterium]
MATGGIFISFEGIDGAGKSTHVEALAQAFRAHGRRVTLSREPGGTPLAEKLRALVLHDAMDAMTEALLVFAARRDHLKQLIEPALAEGAVVLCDRFTDASFAYQGAGRGFDLKLLSVLEQMVQAIPGEQSEVIRQPDLTIWFDLPASIAASRLALTRAPDKFEAQPLEFFSRVAAGYSQRMSANPRRFARIDADASREAVWLQVLRSVQGRGWLA